MVEDGAQHHQAVRILEGWHHGVAVHPDEPDGEGEDHHHRQHRADQGLHPLISVLTRQTPGLLLRLPGPLPLFPILFHGAILPAGGPAAGAEAHPLIHNFKVV